MTVRNAALLSFTLLLNPAFAWNTPVHTAPSNGSDTWVGAKVDWVPVSGSQAYQLQVDTSANFNSPLFFSATQAYINSTDGNGDTQRMLSDLRFGTTYFWRVRAYVTGDTSAWSIPWTFVTRDLVTLSSPDNGSVRWTGLTLDWAVHRGVTFYDAQADTSANFDSPALREVSHAYVNSTDGNGDTEWQLKDLYFGKTYHWRVRARNDVDTCTWSTSWSFITRDQVNLNSPANLALNRSVAGITLNWAPHAGVTTYQLQWDTTYQFNSGLLQTVVKPYVNSTDGNSDTQHATGALLNDQWYVWRVRAINAVDTSVWTSRIFSTGSTLLEEPSIPELISPANGSIITSSLTDLEWTAANHATAYEYRFGTMQDLSNAMPIPSSGTQVQVGPLMPGTTYFWSIRGLNAVIASEWSDTWSFTYDQATDISATTPEDLRVFPNPTTNLITVTLSNGFASRLLLSDPTGRTVRDQQVSGHSFSTDLSELRPGTYVLQVLTTHGSFTRKLVRSY